MTTHKFVQIELTDTDYNDDFIYNMFSNFSEELSEKTEKVIIDHLRTFIEYLVVIRRVCEVRSYMERCQLVDDYVKWYINTKDNVDGLIKEFKADNGDDY